MRKIFCIIITTVIFLSTASGGSNGLAFLQISPDVRSSAMGETGVAAGDERGASHYNPALLGIMDRRGISLAHHQWIQDVGVNFLEVHFISKLNIEFSLISTGVEDIEVRTNPTTEPEAYIDSQDLSAGLAFSYSVRSNFHMGLNLKFIHEHIYSENTDGMALDLGLLWAVSERLTIGVSAVNLGRMSKMLEEAPELPATGRVGAAYTILTAPLGKVQLAAGLTYVREEEFRGNTGIEWQPIGLIALRGGYLFNYDERNFTAGAGLRWKNLGFDFAYLPFDSDLGEVKRFGVWIDF